MDLSNAKSLTMNLEYDIDSKEMKDLREIEHQLPDMFKLYMLARNKLIQQLEEVAANGKFTIGANNVPTVLINEFKEKGYQIERIPNGSNNIKITIGHNICIMCKKEIVTSYGNVCETCVQKETNEEDSESK